MAMGTHSPSPAAARGLAALLLLLGGETVYAALKRLNARPGVEMVFCERCWAE